jgi:hypothetical protein
MSTLIPVVTPPRDPPERLERTRGLPEVLREAPHIASDPWLPHTFGERLELELESIGLLGDSDDEDQAGAGHDESEQDREVADLRAHGRRQQEILKHLPE